mgnify:FL=1
MVAVSNAQPKFNVVKENLGPLVNDQQDQILPVFSPERKTLYFSQNTGVNEVYEVWKTQLADNGTWSAKQKVSYLNGPSALNNYVFGAYASNTFIINGRFDNKNDSTAFNKGFSWYTVKGNSFSVKNAQTFLVDGLDEMLQGQFANAFYHTGKKILLLSFAYMGKRDLFVCTPKPNQKEPLLQWNKPVRLPNTINTPFEESCPFLDESGTVLYFSSNRPGGFGGDDIYCSKLLSADFMQWTPAQNLGFYVNSNKSELYYSVSSADSYAYFVSYKNNYGAGDIFRIKFEMETKWNATVTQNSAVPPPSSQPQPSPAINPASTTPGNQTNIPSTTIMTLPPIGKDKLAVEEYKPNNVLLLLDVSQSMSQGTKMNLLRKATDQLLSKLRYIDKVSLITFGERALLRYSTSSLISKDSVLGVMQRLQPNEGETYINPGLDIAYKKAIETYIEEGNNEVMVVTDGYFSISQQSVDLIKRNPQIRLTFVLVDAGSITQNIIDYIKRRFPDSIIVQMENENKDVNRLLENVKMNSRKN